MGKVWEERLKLTNIIHQARVDRLFDENKEIEDAIRESMRTSLYSSFADGNLYSLLLKKSN